MNGTYLLIGTIFVVAVIILTVVLVVLKKHQYKVLKDQVERLDREKNLISSTPVMSELEKVEAIVKNAEMEEKYQNWQRRFEVIKNDRINTINDMLNELDMAVTMKDYKGFDSKIAKVEMEVYKVKESADRLLKEIQEITVSDEKYRSIVTKLKSKYRQLVSEFNGHKEDYDEIADTIELQLETIEKRFLDFEKHMEKNEYEEVKHIVKALDTMIDHMGTAIVDVPNLVLLSKKLIPKRIEEIESSQTQMKEEGYNLEYLNINYNMEECNKNVNVIVDKISVLNLDDCMFELKTILDYLDSILDTFEKEKHAKEEFDKKIKKTSKVIKDIFKQIDSIRDLYDLKDDEVKEMEEIKLELESIRKDYNAMLKDEINTREPYTALVKKLEFLSNLLVELESNLDVTLKKVGSMQDDELRAREQLDEISDLLKQCKLTIRTYKLPIITNNYFVELSEANDAIDEIGVELSKKPIVIETLNTRVDTARDLALKLYKTTNDMVKTASLAEMVIVYGNRYRSNAKEIDKGLENAEMLYHKGSYKESLEASLSAIELVDTTIREKINSINE